MWPIHSAPFTMDLPRVPQLRPLAQSLLRVYRDQRGAARLPFLDRHLHDRRRPQEARMEGRITVQVDAKLLHHLRGAGWRRDEIDYLKYWLQTPGEGPRHQLRAGLDDLAWLREALRRIRGVRGDERRDA